MSFIQGTLNIRLAPASNPLELGKSGKSNKVFKLVAFCIQTGQAALQRLASSARTMIMWPPALGDQVYRNIILFDKHVRQLDQTGLESVLANKIGHYKKAHILKTIALAVVGSLPFLFLVAVMAKPDWLLRGCSFAPGDIVPALLLAGWPGDILGVPGDSSFVASP